MSVKNRKFCSIQKIHKENFFFFMSSKYFKSISIKEQYIINLCNVAENIRHIFSKSLENQNLLHHYHGFNLCLNTIIVTNY